MAEKEEREAEREGERQKNVPPKNWGNESLSGLSKHTREQNPLLFAHWCCFQTVREKVWRFPLRRCKDQPAVSLKMQAEL